MGQISTTVWNWHSSCDLLSLVSCFSFDHDQISRCFCSSLSTPPPPRSLLPSSCETTRLDWSSNSPQRKLSHQRRRAATAATAATAAPRQRRRAVNGLRRREMPFAFASSHARSRKSLSPPPQLPPTSPPPPPPTPPHPTPLQTVSGGAISRCGREQVRRPHEIDIAHAAIKWEEYDHYWCNGGSPLSGAPSN